MQLSILIPARNEEFLNETIESILNNIEADTEIIVVLDGQWAVKPIPQHERVTVIYNPESVGQRKATNQACRIARGKYVMKLDAHCAVGKGFDRILLEDIKDDWTIVPKMYNLHAFDWVCKKCGHRRYQGKSGKCEKCGGEEYKDIVWKPKPNPETTAMRFDKNLKFQYWSAYKKHQKGDLVETMSILGACFMLSKKRYWELNICDEEFGSWGQQGTEVACKSWLSGGKLIVDKRTWFAHMFRTQGGDFGFPYKLSNKQVEHARRLSKELFLKGKWKSKHDLQWLINKFNPPEWNDKGIIFYTDNQLHLKIAHKVQRRLKKMGLPIVSASLKPMTFGDNIVINKERGIEAYFTQIYEALKKSTADIVYFCEHDVLYNKSHFDFTPLDDKFYFNTNVWKVDWETGKAYKVDDMKQVSGMVCRREVALKFYKYKLAQYQAGYFDKHYEPQKDRVAFQSKEPLYDIRHDNNLTKTKWKPEEFKNKKYTKGWQEKIIKLNI